MKNRNSFRVMALCFALAMLPLLSACLSHRTAGTVLDDQTMEVRVIDAIYTGDEIGEESHIKVEVHDSIVLLMGETDTEAKKELAMDRASKVAHVGRVVNEVEVKESADFSGKMNNSWLSAKVNTALTTKNPISGADASRIKVVTADKTVYLMGIVTRQEGDAVAEVARNVGGVEKVVKVFSYTD